MARETIILGISPGTRAVGLVILKNNAVIDWHIKSFKQRWTKQKLNRILHSIQDIIQLHNVTVVALKVPHEDKQSSNLKSLLSQLKKLMQKQNLIAYEYSLNDLKEAETEVNLLNKRMIMNHLAHLYPCMETQYHKELQNRNPYYLKCFEALLAAHHCAKALQHKGQ